MDSTKFSKPISLKRIQLDDGLEARDGVGKKGSNSLSVGNVKRQSTRGSTKLLHA